MRRQNRGCHKYRISIRTCSYKESQIGIESTFASESLSYCNQRAFNFFFTFLIITEVTRKSNLRGFRIHIDIYDLAEITFNPSQFSISMPWVSTIRIGNYSYLIPSVLRLYVVWIHWQKITFHRMESFYKSPCHGIWSIKFRLSISKKYFAICIVRTAIRIPTHQFTAIYTWRTTQIYIVLSNNNKTLKIWYFHRYPICLS